MFLIKDKNKRHTLLEPVRDFLFKSFTIFAISFA